MKADTITLHGTADPTTDTAAIAQALKAEPSVIVLEGGSAIDETVCIGPTRLIGNDVR